MAANPDEDTEFNDALRKHGILPPREPPPRTPSPPPSPTLDDVLAEFTPSELREIGEDTKDDEMERVVDAYRRQRIADDKKEERRGRFGRVYPIGREDYTKEVSDASRIDEDDDEDEKGTGVVCFLYKDGLPRSDRAFQHIQALAVRYPRTKFVSIVGDKCIPNLPDTRIPLIIMYRKGEIRNQIVAWGADRERPLQELEAALMAVGVVDLPERRPVRERADDDDSSDEEDDEDDDPSSRMRSKSTSTNARAPKNIRQSANKDDDSDFEFDL